MAPKKAPSRVPVTFHSVFGVSELLGALKDHIELFGATRGRALVLLTKLLACACA